MMSEMKLDGRRVTKVVYETHSPGETEALAQKLAGTLKAGDVLALDGDLGAGKTAFTRGLARGLGFEGAVTSPTFTIVNEYEGGRLPLFHFDLYRLSSPEELFDIGWEDYLDRGGVCCVEWSRLGGELMAGAIHVTFTRLSDTGRSISIEGASLC